MSFRFLMAADGTARSWGPFALTRPVGELLFGVETLRARCERVLGARCEGYVGRPALAGFDEPGAPPCLPELPGPAAEGHAGTLVLSSRFAPAEDAFASLLAAGGEGLGPAPVALLAGTEVAGAWLPPGAPVSADALSPPPEWPRKPVEGDVLDSIWQLMSANGARVAADVDRFPEQEPPPGAHRTGGRRFSAAAGVRVEPGVVFDLSEGPVALDEDVRVRAFSRIAGPAYVGPGSVVLGGAVANTSIGPGCKVHGEVSSSVLLGFANKAHTGFLGHSVVGRWANLGAGTTNSNLKNTYGPVRYETGGEEPLDTGLVKAGCLLGDHVRAGIGTLFNAGAVVGAGSVVFGGNLLPKRVPPFSWAGPGPGDFDECDIDAFLLTAARVMARRGMSLSEGMRALYRRAFEATRPQPRQA